MSAHPLRRLLRYARPHRGRIRASIACSILNKVFDLAPPLLIGMAVDIVVNREDSILAELGIVDASHQLWALAALTLVIWGLESVFEYAQAILWRNLAQQLQHELRLDGYRHVQELDLAFFDDRSTGALLTTLNDDVNQLERFLDSGANQLLQVGTTVVVIGAIFFTLAPGVAWYAFLPIPFILWGSFAVQRRIAPRYAEVRERAAGLGGLLANNLGGIATIKSYTAEEYENGRLRAESDRYRDANRGAIRLSSAFSPLIRMVIVLGFICTLVLGGEAAFAGTLRVSSYAVMVFLTQRLLWPLTGLGATVDLYQRAMASTTRVLDLLDTPIHVRGGEEPLRREEVRGHLEFDAVSFAYSNGIPVLDALTLDVPEGSTAAVVGATGAGKSTVLKLLLRFHAPTGGSVRLDGTPLEELILSDLRHAIGFVSQEPYLFTGTVRENIEYGSFGATDAEIEAAARAAEAHEFVASLPEGYDSVVGERGIKLSGGQRQRIALARAVLRDPPILVLDEATSAVDNETEAAIQRSLERVCRGRTTIIVAHRLSTIRHADAIHVLDAGRLVESGTHEELIGRDGIYARLWRVQTGTRTGGEPPERAAAAGGKH